MKWYWFLQCAFMTSLWSAISPFKDIHIIFQFSPWTRFACFFPQTVAECTSPLGLSISFDVLTSLQVHVLFSCVSRLCIIVFLINSTSRDFDVCFRIWFCFWSRSDCGDRQEWTRPALGSVLSSGSVTQQFLDCGPLIQNLPSSYTVQVLVSQDHERVLVWPCTTLRGSDAGLMAWSAAVLGRWEQFFISGDITPLTDQSRNSVPPQLSLIRWSRARLDCAVELGCGLSVGPGFQCLGGSG